MKLEIIYSDGNVTLAVDDVADQFDGPADDATIRRRIFEMAGDAAAEGPWPSYTMRGEGELIEAVREALAQKTR